MPELNVPFPYYHKKNETDTFEKSSSFAYTTAFVTQDEAPRAVTLEVA